MEFQRHEKMLRRIGLGLVIIGVVSGADLTLIARNKYSATCLDGSRPGYYWDKGKHGIA